MSRTWQLLIICLLLAGGCAPLPVDHPEIDVQEAVSQTLAVLEFARTPQPTAAAPPIAATDPPTIAPPPPATPLPMPTVVHLTMPDEQNGVASYMSDPSSEKVAADRQSLSDFFLINIYERPFTSREMDYLPHLDLVYATLRVRSPWVYATLFVEQPPPSGSRATFGIEIDGDRDGRGEWLIRGRVPVSGSWTAEGVSVYADANRSVGGEHAMLSDEPSSTDDGYEQVLLENGRGEDPDLAWVRLDPQDGRHLQLAFKWSLIGRDRTFFWSGFVEENENLPASFDFNDHYSLQAAGSPDPSSEFYPLDQLAALDSTCRWAYGFEPTGSEIGVCAGACVPGEGFQYCYFTGRERICVCLPECYYLTRACEPCTISCR